MNQTKYLFSSSLASHSCAFGMRIINDTMARHFERSEKSVTIRMRFLLVVPPRRNDDA